MIIRTRKACLLLIALLSIAAVMPAAGLIGINAITNKAFVPNNADGTVSVIDGATFGVVATISVGQHPYAAAVNSATNKIYVSTCADGANCVNRGSVAVIDGSTLHVQTVTVGIRPENTVVNPVTNRIYVVNVCGNDPNCNSPGTVTAINGSNLATHTVSIGNQPTRIAINSVTNKIYVLNSNSASRAPGSVTVIDGATLATQTVPLSILPTALAVDPLTNKIFATNACGSYILCDGPGTLTIIDGATLSTQTVNVGYFPLAVSVDSARGIAYVGSACGSDLLCESGPTINRVVESTLGTASVNVCSFESGPGVMAMDPATNKLYVPCYPILGGGQSGVAVVDGAAFTAQTYNFGSILQQAAVDLTTNTVYLPDGGSNMVWVINGFPAPAAQFVPVIPCRLVDTRGTHHPVQRGSSQSFLLPQLGCGIPMDAAAYSLNVTVVPQGPLGYLSIWPTGEDQPVVSTLNSPDGRVKANAAIVPAGAGGAVNVYATDATDVIIDIDGYFAAPGASTLAFYPLQPCRVIDTRGANGGLGGPYLHAGRERDFSVRNSSCIPQNVDIAAYSMNFTVVPHPMGQPLGYLTVWPEGESQPTVSTLNNPNATVVANAAIVPAGSGGGIATYPDKDTDLIVDINGYFAPAGAGGYSFYPEAPCRAYDSRDHNRQPFSGKRTVAVQASVCAPPPNQTVQAYVFNATVVPDGSLGYLTLWPDHKQQPVVSTLNATDGFVTSNMAIVPTTTGPIDAYAEGMTHLILDISGYFAQ